MKADKQRLKLEKPHTLMQFVFDFCSSKHCLFMGKLSTTIIKYVFIPGIVSIVLVKTTAICLDAVALSTPMLKTIVMCFG